MRRVGLAVIVALSLFAALLASEAQQPTRVHRIAYLLNTTREQEPFLETFLEAMRVALHLSRGQLRHITYTESNGHEF